MNKELVIIGGGSAGLNAAIAAYKQGIRDILIIEQNDRLGGILNQCIHNGFGLQWFNEELTGPAFANRCIKEVKKLQIEYWLNTTVIKVNNLKEIEYVSLTSANKIQAQAIIFAVGCYERNKGAINIAGYRPRGIYTAGMAQKYLNETGYLVGKNIFILGSGDIGLIMARRMTLEGAKVLGVAEIMPYSNGLKRNIVQCLDDYDIPLYLSHTVTDIYGKDNITEIEVSEVTSDFKVIPNSQKYFKCDTLLLSVGLIPENSLLEQLAINIDPITKGPIVDENFQTELAGVFACGNGLHVHDLVDYVAKEAESAGKAAANFLKNQKVDGPQIKLIAAKGIGYILPQVFNQQAQQIIIKTRVKKPMSKAKIIFVSEGIILKQIIKMNLFPAEMLEIPLTFDVYQKVKTEMRVSIIECE